MIDVLQDEDSRSCIGCHTPKFPKKFDAVVLNNKRKITGLSDFIDCKVQV